MVHVELDFENFKRAVTHANALTTNLPIVYLHHSNVEDKYTLLAVRDNVLLICRASEIPDLGQPMQFTATNNMFIPIIPVEAYGL